MERNERAELRERLIQLTRDLVAIESTHSNPDQRKYCFQVIRNHLDSLPGLRLELLESNGFESLLALPDGIEEPDVLFCGHLDVVEHPGEGIYDTELRDGRIYGPGAGDMKGQLAILMELIRRLHAERPGCSAGLAITSDEECGGENGVRFLTEDVGLRCGVAIVPDGGSLTEITLEEKGILHLTAIARGDPGHAARPWKWNNPLEFLIERLLVAREAFAIDFGSGGREADDAGHWHDTLSITKIETPNDSHNRIPEIASAMIDVRFPRPGTADSMLARVAGLLGPDIELRLDVGAEPTHFEPDEEFLRITSEITGHDARAVRVAGGSDARFFFARGIPVIISRPNVGNLHGRDEWIDIDSMVTYFEICRRYVESRTRGER